MVLRNTNYRVNSFRDIADRYANTKPIRGTKIIPIGSRTRKFEHIVKVSDTLRHGIRSLTHNQLLC